MSLRIEDLEILSGGGLDIDTVQFVREYENNRAFKSLPAYLAIQKTIVDGVDIGYGVFALARIKANVELGLYEGEIIEEEDANDVQQYNFGLRDGRIINADDPETSNWTRYINTADKNQKNCVAKDVTKDSIAIFTTKEILPGQQLFLDYGPKYIQYPDPKEMLTLPLEVFSDDDAREEYLKKMTSIPTTYLLKYSPKKYDYYFFFTSVTHKEYYKSGEAGIASILAFAIVQRSKRVLKVFRPVTGIYGQVLQILRRRCMHIIADLQSPEPLVYSVKGYDEMRSVTSVPKFVDAGSTKEAFDITMKLRNLTVLRATYNNIDKKVVIRLNANTKKHYYGKEIVIQWARLLKTYLLERDLLVGKSFDIDESDVLKVFVPNR